MAKTPTDIRSLARSHTETAIRTLVGIMREKTAPAAARVAAAQALLDRGYGKPAQAVNHGGEDGGPVLITFRWDDGKGAFELPAGRMVEEFDDGGDD